MTDPGYPRFEPALLSPDNLLPSDGPTDSDGPDSLASTVCDEEACDVGAAFFR